MVPEAEKGGVGSVSPGISRWKYTGELQQGRADPGSVPRRRRVCPVVSTGVLVVFSQKCFRPGGVTSLLSERARGGRCRAGQVRGGKRKRKKSYLWTSPWKERRKKELCALHGWGRRLRHPRRGCCRCDCHSRASQGLRPVLGRFRQAW